MNRELLHRLKEALGKKWSDIYTGSVKKDKLWHSKLGRTASQWRGLCTSLNIQALDESYDYEPGGQILEELVVVPDPNPFGMWLEMSRETATKILAVGFP